MDRKRTGGVSKLPLYCKRDFNLLNHVRRDEIILFHLCSETSEMGLFYWCYLEMLILDSRFKDARLLFVFT